MDKKIFKDAALAGADWFVNSQVKMEKPHWDANDGRFIYTYFIPTKNIIRGLSWTQARGIFCLLGAYKLSKKKIYLETAVKAANYAKLLQIYDEPGNPVRQFTIKEHLPQGTAVNTRDSVEVALSFLYLYKVTGEADYLRRAVDFEKWFSKNAWGPGGWPVNIINYSPAKVDTDEKSYQAGNGIFYYYLYKATGSKKYIQPLLKLADKAIDKFIRKDGAIFSGSFDSHHGLKTGEILNDDGLMSCILCAYSATGKSKYLDVAKKHAEWIMNELEFPLPVHSALPCMCNFLINLSQATACKKYKDWAAEKMAKFVLPAQITASKDIFCLGAFRGEDEPVEYYAPKGSKSTDYVNTRVTAYSVLASLKLCGIDGPCYSSKGW